MSLWTLHHGDCLDPISGLATLADRSVDHVICDPPYSEHVHAKSRTNRTNRDAERGARRDVSRNVDLGFEHITESDRASVAGHLARVARRWVLVCSDLESEHLWRTALTSAGMDVVRFGLWVKEGATPQLTGDRPATGAEAIVIAHQRGAKRWNGGGRHAVWSVPIALDRGGTGARVHTTQKPLDLMLALVRDFTDPGETILDPFAGSGTTGVAAIQCGRRFVGWEREPKYHAVASKRLGEAREQPSLALGAPTKAPKTADLFGTRHQQKGDASGAVNDAQKGDAST